MSDIYQTVFQRCSQPVLQNLVEQLQTLEGQLVTLKKETTATRLELEEELVKVKSERDTLTARVAELTLQNTKQMEQIARYKSSMVILSESLVKAGAKSEEKQQD
tara:strand:- start:149 stop:463 length:315 start_codon:yes stop_codon:yes gene_type:complete